MWYKTTLKARGSEQIMLELEKELLKNSSSFNRDVSLISDDLGDYMLSICTSRNPYEGYNNYMIFIGADKEKVKDNVSAEITKLLIEMGARLIK